MSSPAEKLVAASASLVTLPAIFDRLQNVIDRPGSSVADIAAVVTTDPGLAARLLRLANSAFYGFPRRLEKLTDAVAVIGTRQLRDLVLGTIAVQKFSGIDSSLVDLKSFWRHSVACGLVARDLARRRREPNPERLFVAGLLHDVGSLIVYSGRPEEATECLRRHNLEGRPYEHVEREVLGFDHAAVGAALVDAWKLPAALRHTLAEHHHYRSGSPHTLDTALVHVADVVSSGVGFTGGGESFVPPLCKPAWELLGFSPTVVEEVVSGLVAQLDEVENLMTSRGAK